MAGRSIVVVSWVALAAFVVTVVPDAAGLHVLDGLSSTVALVLFLAALPIWIYAFGLGVVRSGRGEDVRLGGLFFLHGSAPAPVRRSLLAALGATVVVAAATAWANAFAVLVPVFPLSMLTLWGARHGSFGARPAPAVSR